MRRRRVTSRRSPSSPAWMRSRLDVEAGRLAAAAIDIPIGLAAAGPAGRRHRGAAATRARGAAPSSRPLSVASSVPPPTRRPAPSRGAPAARRSRRSCSTSSTRSARSTRLQSPRLQAGAFRNAPRAELRHLGRGSDAPPQTWRRRAGPNGCPHCGPSSAIVTRTRRETAGSGARATTCWTPWSVRGRPGGSPPARTSNSVASSTRRDCGWRSSPER